MASLQIEKNKEQSSGSTKQKSRSVKGKGIFAKLPSCCYKGHVANNNLLDIDFKSLDSDLSDLDKEEVVEVATCS